MYEEQQNCRGKKNGQCPKCVFFAILFLSQLHDTQKATSDEHSRTLLIFSTPPTTTTARGKPAPETSNPDWRVSRQQTRDDRHAFSFVQYARRCSYCQPCKLRATTSAACTASAATSEGTVALVTCAQPQQQRPQIGGNKKAVEDTWRPQQKPKRCSLCQTKSRRDENCLKPEGVFSEQEGGTTLLRQ